MSEKFHVGQGQYDGNALTVFPVWLESAPIEGYCWKSSHINVGENAAGANVNNLTVSNHGHRPHIVLEGDIFEGGRQNRVLTRSLVLTRGEEREVPVACVEEGRWHGTGRHTGGRRRASMSVRYGVTGTMARIDLERYLDADAGSQAQQEVWQRIRQHEGTRGVTEGHSLTESMDRVDREDYLTYGDDQRVLPGQRGVMIGVGGHIVAAEFFGNVDGLTARFESIISAARYEAMGAPQKRTPSWQARAFAEQLERTPVGENLPKPIEFDTPAGPLAISSFMLAHQLVHAAVFNGAHPLLARV